MSVRLCIAFCLVLLVGCGGEKQARQPVQVGMTYDEVEQILGKPLEIGRGASQLVNDAEQRIFTNDTTFASRKGVWAYPKKVETVGQLLYVRWGYSEIRRDTFYVFERQFKTVQNVRYKPVEHLYISGIGEVDEETYLRYEDGQEVYLDAFTRKPITRSRWEEQVANYTHHVSDRNPGPPVTVRKSKRVEQVVSKTAHPEATGVRCYPFQVTSQKVIIFDASSGRVVEAGYHPIDVSQLPDYEEAL